MQQRHIAELVGYYELLHDVSVNWVSWFGLLPNVILQWPLTDRFWLVRDISKLSNSATGNVTTISARYHAPERASGGERYSGRSEDILRLGSICFEIIYYLYGNPDGNISTWQGTRYSYRASLEEIGKWLELLLTGDQCSQRVQYLAQLSKRMMAYDDKARPSISEVVDALAVDFQDGLSFFGSCCP